MDPRKRSKPDSESPRTGRGHVCTWRSRPVLCENQKDTVLAFVIVCSRSHDCRCCRCKGDEPGRLGVHEVPTANQFDVAQPGNKRTPKERWSANRVQVPRIQSKRDETLPTNDPVHPRA